MMRAGLTGLLAGVALLGGAATHAWADPPRVRQDLAAEGSNWTVDPSPHRSVQWNATGRWGVQLDMDQPVNRDMDFKDVKAGAYFRLTPKLRVGGSVGLGAPSEDLQRLTPPDATPRVHLNTTFSF